MSYVEQLREEGRQEARQEARREGGANFLIRQFSQRFGQLSARLQKQILALSFPQLEELSVGIFDFQSRRDLANWLNHKPDKSNPAKFQRQK
ncbi:MAG: DUF4351 domain-containing protein [Blastocatellia bacterium]